MKETGTVRRIVDICCAVIPKQRHFEDPLGRPVKAGGVMIRVIMNR